MILKNNKHRSRLGFTLPELMVVIAISSLLIVGASMLFVNLLEIYVKNDSRATVLNNVHTALDTLTDDIRMASAADLQNRYQDQHAPLAPSDLLSWHSSNNVLVLATVVEDNNGNILFDDPSRYLAHKNNVIYFLKDKTLYRRVLASPVAGNKLKTTCPIKSPDCGADKKLLNDVTQFKLRYLNETDVEVQPDNARSVEVSATVTTIKFGKPVSVSYKTRMVFRNV